MHARPHESLRLFFALWPDDATRSALQQSQSVLGGRLVPYENLHLTLTFLGQQPAAVVPTLTDVLTHMPAAVLTLDLDRIGYFMRNRIVWAGSHRMPEALNVLHEELQQALRKQAVNFEAEQNFKPHITLARNAPPPPDTGFTPVTWHADRIALAQSVTTPEGPVYRLIASRSLEQPYWLRNEAATPGAAPTPTGHD